MFFDMRLFLFFLVCPQTIGSAGCKRELPPTKQEISNPYSSKVTDILFGHYDMYAYFKKKISQPSPAFSSRGGLKDRLEGLPLGEPQAITKALVKRSR